MAETTEPKKGKITKDMPIGKIVMEHPEAVEVFMKHGMHCIGCMAAHFENLDQGCQAHGIDTDQMVKDLNEAASKHAKQDKPAKTPKKQ
ncbi:DUF1858 domain-containing protein [Candidatus Woesearchaeota archaeon]|nr:DUF1858 domain-containing protein [Candidatus Woesearchaeota archaeon]